MVKSLRREGKRDTEAGNQQPEVEHGAPDQGRVLRSAGVPQEGSPAAEYPNATGKENYENCQNGAHCTDRRKSGRSQQPIAASRLRLDTVRCRP